MTAEYFHSQLTHWQSEIVVWLVSIVLCVWKYCIWWSDSSCDIQQPKSLKRSNQRSSDADALLSEACDKWRLLSSVPMEHDPAIVEHFSNVLTYLCWRSSNSLLITIEKARSWDTACNDIGIACMPICQPLSCIQLKLNKWALFIL